MTADFPLSNDTPGSPEDRPNERTDRSEPGIDLDTNVSLNEPEEDLDPSRDRAEESEPVSEQDAVSDETSTFEPDLDLDLDFDSSEEIANVEARAQVYLRAVGDRVLVVLPPPLDRLDVADFTWQEIWHQLSQRLNGGERFWSPETRVVLVVGDRLLDNSQLQDLEETLADNDLVLSRVQTSRRETAIAAATAGYSVEQQILQAVTRSNGGAEDAASSQPTALALAEPLYLRSTVRSGVEVRHPGTAIVFGDVNPGGTIVADGDIVVWGKLRGIVHAGANGNERAVVAALQMEPTQVRIADTVARVPSHNLDRFYPEVAYVTAQGIRISRAEDFHRVSK